MDGWALILLAVGIIAYFLSKRNKNWFLLVGFGAGLLAGAIWASMIVNHAFRGLVP